MSEQDIKRQRISGTRLVLNLLRSDGPMTNLAILRASYRERGKGLVVNSRVADARELAEREGWTIKCRCLSSEDGVYEYRRVELVPASTVTPELWREVLEGAGA